MIEKKRAGRRAIESHMKHEDLVDRAVELGRAHGLEVAPTEGNDPKGDIRVGSRHLADFIDLIDRSVSRNRQRGMVMVAPGKVDDKFIEVKVKVIVGGIFPSKARQIAGQGISAVISGGPISPAAQQVFKQAGVRYWENVEPSDLEWES